MTITEFIDTGSGANDACLIYKLTNIKNNKVYIGQTKNSLRRRIMSHLTQSRINTKSKSIIFSLLYRNTDMIILIYPSQKYVNKNS